MLAWVKGTGRFVVVSVGIIGLTSLGIDATQEFSTSQSALGIFASKLAADECPAGMVRIDQGGRAYCVDQYEASPADDCSFTTPTGQAQTQDNLNDPDCAPESVKGALPWTHVAKHQAAALCAKAGKRLPTPVEWYMSGLGTVDGGECNVEGALQETGRAAGCRSGQGIHDMIGNAWEIVDAEVVDGVWQELTVPEEGFVAEIDGAGVATLTTSTPQAMFNDDYFWTQPSGRYVMVRGGFYGSGSDAGLYSTHAAIAPTFSSAAIGFRCVLDLSV